MKISEVKTGQVISIQVKVDTRGKGLRETKRLRDAAGSESVKVIAIRPCDSGSIKVTVQQMFKESPKRVYLSPRGEVEAGDQAAWEEGRQALEAAMGW